MMRTSKYLAPLALAFALVMGSVPRADAGFQVTLTAGGVSQTITDNQLGVDANGANNNISIVDVTVNGWTFTFELATTNTSGTPTLAFVNSSVGQVQYTGGGTPTAPTTISIYASANDFTAPTAPPDLLARTGATIQYLAPTPAGNMADPVVVMSYLNTSNLLSTAPGGGGTLIGSDNDEITAGTNDDNAVLNDARLISSLGGSYALSLYLEATLLTPSGGATPSTIDLDGTLQLAPAVPEPGTLAMAVLALPLLGLGYLRHRRRSC